jgi:hypothetical protein
VVLMSVWVASRRDVSERSGQKSDTEKCLIDAVRRILDVSKEMASNQTFSYDAVMPSLIHAVTSQSWRKMLKRWQIHRDNASPHNSRRFREYLATFRAQSLPHPAYNPDLRREASSSSTFSKKD